MAETIADLDARLEQLAREQAFAVEHRNWARDAELNGAIEKLKARRAELEQHHACERPILFSGEMVRAILEGRKTQTRRLVTPGAGQEWLTPAAIDKVRRFAPSAHAWWTMAVEDGHIGSVRCPYGQPGDRLWVKESYRLRADQDEKKPSDDWWKSGASWYEADGKGEPSGCGGAMGKLRPGIFMPRWASRITLVVTDVRVERLQAISTVEAMAEGAAARPVADGTRSYTHGFRALWDSINGKRAPWESNPWVWVLSFQRLEER